MTSTHPDQLTAQELRRALEQLGCSLTLIQGRLSILAAPGVLDDDWRRAIRRRRHALVTLLALEELPHRPQYRTREGR